MVRLGQTFASFSREMRIRRGRAQPQGLDGTADGEVIKTLPVVPRQTKRAMQHIIEIITNASAAHTGGLGGQIKRLADYSRFPEQLAPGRRAAFSQDWFEPRKHAKAERAVGGNVLLAGHGPREIAQ